MRGATTWTVLLVRSERVSIHAPRAGRDACMCCFFACSVCFNPRAPCGARHGCSFVFTCHGSFNPRAPCGARHRFITSASSNHMFQSTRPVRGATVVAAGYRPQGKFQSTRPVRGATGFTSRSRYLTVFQSTRPVRSATRSSWDGETHISCFNPRAPCGARQRRRTLSRGFPSFNPRAPCGARRWRTSHIARKSWFQSTRPVRGATYNILIDH